MKVYRVFIRDNGLRTYNGMRQELKADFYSPEAAWEEIEPEIENFEVHEVGPAIPRPERREWIVVSDANGSVFVQGNYLLTEGEAIDACNRVSHWRMLRVET